MNLPVESGGLEWTIRANMLGGRVQKLLNSALELVPDIDILREINEGADETAASATQPFPMPGIGAPDPAGLAFAIRVGKRRAMKLIELLEVLRETEIEVKQFAGNRLPAPAPKPYRHPRKKRPPTTPPQT